MDLKFKKLTEEAVTPFKKYDVDAGFDLTATWKEEKDKFTVYGTGLAFEIPPGYVGLMFPRSSVTNQDFMLKNSVGVIDASYRGEIMCRFLHAVHDVFEDVTDTDPRHLDQDFYKGGKAIDMNMLNRHMDKYEIGDRICQVVFVKLPSVNLIESEELNETERGTSGYGSSGK